MGEALCQRASVGKARLITWPGVGKASCCKHPHLRLDYVEASKWPLHFCTHPLKVHSQDSGVILLIYKCGHVTLLRTPHGSHQIESQTSYWPTKLCINGCLSKCICQHFPPYSLGCSHTGLFSVPGKARHVPASGFALVPPDTGMACSRLLCLLSTVTWARPALTTQLQLQLLSPDTFRPLPALSLSIVLIL